MFSLTRAKSATIATLAVAVAAVVAVASASGGAPTVKAAHNAALGRTIVVDAHGGRTLYALRPETAHHLLCTSAACIANWPLLTVSSAHAKLKAGHGVKGHLSILHRSDGKFQVMLRGMPLYRFAGDSAKGQTHGNGITAFGGTWHVVSAAKSSAGTTTTTTPTTTTPGYTAPGYSPPSGY
jgi:predicted lipoprotein with Yx(FWY)xxD motif